ncbi:MAG: hypothetical protein ACI9MB_004666 [Verrucomicrobiales bacterium]|jgi:hypothetical protein
MKTKTILTFLLAVPLALASCSDKKPDTAGGESDKETAGSSGEYPLTTCVVSDEKLGSMGKPVEIVHEGTTVKFCCKSCIPEFEEDPAKFLAKLKK